MKGELLRTKHEHGKYIKKVVSLGGYLGLSLSIPVANCGIFEQYK